MNHLNALLGELFLIFKKPVKLSLPLSKSGSQKNQLESLKLETLYLSPKLDIRFHSYRRVFIYSGSVFFLSLEPTDLDFLLSKTQNSKGGFSHSQTLELIPYNGSYTVFKTTLDFNHFEVSLDPLHYNTIKDFKEV